VALIVVLVGIVILVVSVLKPEEAPTPTVAGPMEQIMTVLPVPTGFEEVITSVVTVIPTEFMLPGLFGPTPTPTPGAAIPGPDVRHAELPHLPWAPVPLPESPARVEKDRFSP
jgi:hypothetical protein